MSVTEEGVDPSSSCETRSVLEREKGECVCVALPIFFTTSCMMNHRRF